MMDYTSGEYSMLDAKLFERIMAGDEPQPPNTVLMVGTEAEIERVSRSVRERARANAARKRRRKQQRAARRANR